MTNNLLLTAYKAIDSANANDPNTTSVNGENIPKELLYGQRMTNTLDAYDNEASTALKLAARSQHICRWEIPRDSYPMDRIGYLKWREGLKKFHASKAAGILVEVGFNEEVVERVSFLIQKKKLKKDEETQALEDVICLVFLNYYFDDFIVKHNDEKLISILQKTWGKMSAKGHDKALTYQYSKKGMELIKKALEL